MRYRKAPRRIRYADTGGAFLKGAVVLIQVKNICHSHNIEGCLGRFNFRTVDRFQRPLRVLQAVTRHRNDNGLAFGGLTRAVFLEQTCNASG